MAAAVVATFFMTTGLGAVISAPACGALPQDAPAPLAGGGPDAYGYTWVDSKVPAPQVNYSWVEISGTGTNAALVGDDAYKSASIGFSFMFYGNTYTTAYFSTNGLISLGAGTSAYGNVAIPITTAPNNIIAAYWDDLQDAGGMAYYKTTGTAPNRVFTVEWMNWWTLAGLGPMTFEILLFESGDILFQYNTLGAALGGSATVGIENSLGTIGLQYSLNTASLQNGLAILFSPGPLPYDFELSPSAQTHYGGAGTSVDHVLTIENMGTQADTYNISTGDVVFNGLTWNKQGMVVSVGTTYDSRYAIAPSVIKDNGTFKMWYSGNDGTNGHVMYATSPDGSTWTKFGMVLDHSNSYESAGASDPTVLKVGGQYKMWYTAYDGTTYRIAYATSSNGQTWTKYGIVLDAGWAGELHVALPHVMYDGSIYKMWYNNYVAAYNLNYATSPDGITWTKLGLVLPYGETYAESGVYSPDVVKLDGRYHMWYSGKSSGGTVRILYADSPDGVAWSRHGVAVNYGSAYETDSVDRSCTMLDGNTVRMWYSGYVWSTPAYGRVMYATQTYSTQTGLWPVTFRNMADTMNITQVSAAAGSNVSFIARVSIPPTAIAGDFDNATVYVDSMGNAGLQRTAGIRTEVTPIADVEPPEHSNESPQDLSAINEPSPLIEVDVTDATGVDLSTVRLYVNGFSVFSDKTPIAGGYHVSYLHLGTFSDGDAVTCRIVASDLLGLVLDWNWTFTVDLVPPQVLWALPPDGAGGVPLDSVIQVCFSEEMDRAAVQAAFALTPLTSGSFSWNGTVMAYTPSAPLLFDTDYTAGFSAGACDPAGNSLGNYTWEFSTGDVAPPQHSDEFPSVGGRTSDTDPEISVHATDMSGVNASTIRFYVQGFRVDCAMAVIPGGYNVSYWHEAGFAQGTIVTCRIVAMDMAGNLLDFTWQFTVDSLASFQIPIHAGWNLVSIPVVLANTSVPAVLGSINGQWDVVKSYRPDDPADPWKTYRVSGTANDLAAIDHRIGFWLHALGNATLEVAGTLPGYTAIVLKAGWNLVGYPTLDSETTVSSAFFGTGCDRIEGYDAMSPGFVRELSGSEPMAPGNGYWVHTSIETTWAVSWSVPVIDDQTRSALPIPSAAFALPEPLP